VTSPPWLDGLKVGKKPFWEAIEACSGKKCIEKLMQRAAEYRVYKQLIAWILSLKQLGELLAMWKVSFADETIVGGAHDDVHEQGAVVDEGGPHNALLGLFFRVFEERNLHAGVPIGDGSVAQQAEFSAFGRLLLHCFYQDIPTGIFLSPPLYLVAFGKLDAAATRDWGTSSVCEALLTGFTGSLTSELEKHVSWLCAHPQMTREKLEQDVKMYLDGALLDEDVRPTFSGDTVLVGSEYVLPGDDPLLQGGDELLLEERSSQLYMLLSLHRRFFHPKRAELARALASGMHGIAPTAFDALARMPVSQLISEFEGKRNLTAPLFLQNVAFAPGTSIEQREWFEQVVRSGQLDLTILLRFATNLVTLNPDGTLPKGDKINVEWWAAPLPRSATCTKELFLPKHCRSAAELLELLRSCYEEQEHSAA